MKYLDAITGGVPQAIGKQKTATIYTDSSITIDSLKNPRNHKSLIHKIREKVTALGENNRKYNSRGSRLTSDSTETRWQTNWRKKRQQTDHCKRATIKFQKVSFQVN